ncbi:MAG: DHHA1 domain-containing protein [Candidatus Saliniplasma sp.]
MQEKAKEIADKLKGSEKVHIVSHIDADGLSSAGIAYKALKRSGVDVDFEFIKQLESEKLKEIKSENHELIWFTDLGSGQLKGLSGVNCVITDHHEPQGQLHQNKVGEVRLKDRGNLLNYSNSNLNPEPDILELNPHRYGIDGASELCGAGTTYLVARELGENADLSKLAVVGAVGDLQASKEGRLIGKNREILEEGVSEGHVDSRLDARFYGLESRPLFKVLQYASDPVLPGLTGDEESCINFLINLDIPMKNGDEWRRWYHLSKSEKRKILSSLGKRLLKRGYPYHYVDNLIGEVYTFPDEEIGTMLHEAKEFSTLLNSCGRYNKGDVGLQVCLGDRGEYLKKAEQLLKGHQKVLVECMNYVESAGGVKERDLIQYFHGKDEIPDTVLGTVAGMILGSGDVDRELVMIAFANSSEREGLKVSSRGTKRLVDRGLDLSEIMSIVSDEFGGEGGGHDIAAGAYIPQGVEEDFLDRVEKMIKKQLD